MSKAETKATICLMKGMADGIDVFYQLLMKGKDVLGLDETKSKLITLLAQQQISTLKMKTTVLCEDDDDLDFVEKFPEIVG